MDPLIDINDYLKATDDAAAQEPIDPNKFDELIGALVQAINNDLLRTDGAQEPTEDQNYAGHNVNDILNITGVDSTDQRQWRLHYDEVNHVLTFQENTGTNTSPIWQDRFSFELDAAPQVLLRDNTGLKFPDGSQIHSTDFDSSGYVKLTTAQGDIEFDSLIWVVGQSNRILPGTLKYLTLISTEIIYSIQTTNCWVSNWKTEQPIPALLLLMPAVCG